MAKAMSIAKYLILKASERTENDLTNLKLQKLLYFAQGVYSTFQCRSLIDEKFEAWEYGPVIRSVFRGFQEFGNSPLSLFDSGNLGNNELDKNTINFLDLIWEEYAVYSAFHLVDLTHQQNPWKNAYMKGRNTELDQSDICETFSELVNDEIKTKVASILN